MAYWFAVPGHWNDCDGARSRFRSCRDACLSRRSSDCWGVCLVGLLVCPWQQPVSGQVAAKLGVLCGTQGRSGKVEHRTGVLPEQVRLGPFVHSAYGPPTPAGGGQTGARRQPVIGDQVGAGRAPGCWHGHVLYISAAGPFRQRERNDEGHQPGNRRHTLAIRQHDSAHPSRSQRHSSQKRPANGTQCAWSKLRAKVLRAAAAGEHDVHAGDRRHRRRQRQRP